MVLFFKLDYTGIPEVDDVITRKAWDMCLELQIPCILLYFIVKHIINHNNGVFELARVLPQFVVLRCLVIGEKTMKKKSFVKRIQSEMTDKVMFGNQNAKILSEIIKSCDSLRELWLHSIYLLYIKILN